MKGNEINFHERIKTKKWPIPKKTGNKDKLEKNDKIIFYLGGEKNMKFMGTATIDSIKTSNDDDFIIELDNTNIWRNPIKVSAILDSLEFIPKNWGSFFQGKIVWISKKDHSTIIENIDKQIRKEYN